jgi:hypothetical protein
LTLKTQWWRPLGDWALCVVKAAQMLDFAHSIDQHASMKRLRVVDSITELDATDAGCIAVSGSHGGISSARYALAARPLLSVFNDAGVGKNAAGIAALDFLQAHGLAACTVAHDSASIGLAHSSLEDGVVSHANDLARARGVLLGQTCRAVVNALVQHSP